MLRFLSNIFSKTRKNKSDSKTPSPKSSSSKSKTRKSLARSPPKSILKKSTSTRKKSLTFAPTLKSVRVYAPDDKEIDILRETPKCSPPQRPKKYPCRLQNTIFEDSEEFNQYARDVSDRTITLRRQGLPSRSSHYSTMKRKLKETGSYKKIIPPEYRFYDQNTGKIIDLRLFTPDDEWSD
jgi:hypothetical protein